MKQYNGKPSKFSPEQLTRLFPYSLGEDIGNAVSHCVGSFVALGLLISLAWIAGRYGDWLDGLAFVFYGITILFMFVISTVYHSMTNHAARNVMKRMDHVAIFILIIGSYTPYVFSLLNTTRGYVTYICLSVLTVIGVVFKAIYAGRFKKIGTLIYVLMGWASLILLPQIVAKLPTMGVVFFVASGLIYTIGALFYAFSKFKYSHTVWHIFVLIAVISMYLSIALYILQYR
ncbi:MAG: hemolysin III family protein [Neisseriales bacterium]|jgi:hemolysin III|nr:MAG: hemolysin III family protein [Neisseriales bacterium]